MDELAKLQEVVSIEDMDLDAYDVNDGRGRQENDSAYGFRLRTHAGATDFVYRNSSNGYYGGWMQTQRTVPADCVSVVSDWHSTKA